ncbi:unnamed protein product [Boreogadus saida]
MQPFWRYRGGQPLQKEESGVPIGQAPPVGHLHAGLRCCRLAEEEQSEQLFPLWLHRRFGCHWRPVSALPPPSRGSSCPQPSSGSALSPLCTKTIHLLMSLLYH